MNMNRLGDYFTKDWSVMAGDAGPIRGSTPIVNVTGVYESAVHRAAATCCLARIAKLLGANPFIRSEWWSLDAFLRPPSRRAALESSEDSSILWFAGRGGVEQMELLHAWLGECRFADNGPRALVAVLERQNFGGKCETRLRNIARRHGMELFCEAAPGTAVRKEPAENYLEALRIGSSFGSLDPVTTRIRHWGINE